MGSRPAPPAAGILPALLILAVAMTVVMSPLASASVSYDHKAIVIDGRRRILISGSIHYPRSVPEVCPVPTLLVSGKCGSFGFGFHIFWGFLELLLCVVILCFSGSSLGLTFGSSPDVAGSHPEGERWRLGRDTDVCVLERPRTFSWRGTRKLESFFAVTLGASPIFVLFI